MTNDLQLTDYERKDLIAFCTSCYYAGVTELF